MDVSSVTLELYWALGEERINRVTPEPTQFHEWRRQKDGLFKFWGYANSKLAVPLSADEVHDIWDCIDLTLTKRVRRAFTFQDYLIIAVRADQKCYICNRRPPEVALHIDHILPVSRGGTDAHFNLRFLCQFHNISRGNRFRWADVWRIVT